MSNDFNKLNTTAGDYARWDDTYVFINDANDNYVKLNLGKATFTLFQLNVIALIHSSKRIVFGLGFDLKNEKPTPLPQSLRIHLATKAMLLQHPNPKSSALRDSLGILATFDVTQTRKMVRELSSHASYDALTGLMTSLLTLCANSSPGIKFHPR